LVIKTVFSETKIRYVRYFLPWGIIAKNVRRHRQAFSLARGPLNFIMVYPGRPVMSIMLLEICSSRLNSLKCSSKVSLASSSPCGHRRLSKV